MTVLLSSRRVKAVRFDYTRQLIVPEVAMLIVQVNVLVKPDRVDAFIAATLKNAAASLTEPGIARFDVMRDTQLPNHFVLVEVYRDANARLNTK